MLRSLALATPLLLSVFSGTALSAQEAFDPSSVRCALDASQLKKMYVGLQGDYEWKKGLAQTTKSTGFFDIKTLTPSGADACQVELQQHQCLTLFLDEDWETPFGTHSGDFSCVNLRTGEAIPAGDLAYKNSVQERMIKMRCPHGTDISECSNDSNSKRGNDFRAEVLKANNLEMTSVCAGYIREPRYFKGGKVGDRALCALTNQQGEALYKVIIPMEYSYPAPLKKLDGTTESYRPKAVKIDLSNADAKASLFMPETPLDSMDNGSPAEVLAISLRCTSRMFSLFEQSGATSAQVEEARNVSTAAMSKWSANYQVLFPGNEGDDQATRLYKLADEHAQRHGQDAGATGLEADTKACTSLYQQIGLL
ncbi:MAG: hypothetical protein ACPGMR_09500 [Pontibacterium sp.]